MNPLPRALLALVIVGCAPEYGNEPTLPTTTSTTGATQAKLALKYPIPAGAPQGDVQVESFGLVDVTAKDAPGNVALALHLRVILSDKSATSWTFDTREQRVQLEGREILAPAFASSNAGATPPVVIVDAKEKRVVDLFYLLPTDLQNASTTPPFDALWNVNTGGQITAERTAFGLLVVEPPDGNTTDADNYYGSNYYWGGPYWMNPEVLYGHARSGRFEGQIMIHGTTSSSGRGGHAGGGGSHGGGGGGHGGGR